ncbi:hypothetical protein [Cellulomonas carbonis]|uniref:hypothetical protein n=1 Tax=Cellulomonas carbonis TaxID=1386092 RepID=UPI00137849DD|nr:hypothetical protein [Cellulomonas carbonis]
MVIAVVIGVAAAAIGNWWTFTAAMLIAVSQVLAERDRRRTSRMDVTPDEGRSPEEDG